MQLTLAVLVELNRRGLDELGQGECDAGEMVECCALSQSAVKPSRVLREAELVASRVDNQHGRYWLLSGRLADSDAWLAPYHRFWTKRLEALRAHLEQE